LEHGVLWYGQYYYGTDDLCKNSQPPGTDDTHVTNKHKAQHKWQMVLTHHRTSINKALYYICNFITTQKLTIIESSPVMGIGQKLTKLVTFS